jgi:hypothetical protein
MKMNKDSFIQSLQDEFVPATYSPQLKALWLDKKELWDKAHEQIQDLTDPMSAYIHAYLHRKEGDEGNAAYWYRRAGKRFPEESLEAEWNTVLSTVINAS